MLITPQSLEEGRLLAEERELLRAQWHAAGAEHLPTGFGWFTWLEPYTFHLFFATVLLAGFWMFWQLLHVMKRSRQNSSAKNFVVSTIAALAVLILISTLLPTEAAPSAFAALCILAAGIVMFTWTRTATRSRALALMSVSALTMLWGAQSIGIEALSHEQLGQISDATRERIIKDAQRVKDMSLDEYWAEQGWL